MQGSLPKWLQIMWMCISPLGLTFAGRIAWEKIVWTATRGPQMVGFSLMHIHPEFSIGGILCSFLLILWLVPASVYFIANRKRISVFDIAMVSLSLCVAAAIMVPDTFFAGSH